jgi:hypothetical protein
MKAKTSEKFVGVGQIAQDFGCSERQIRNFVAAGMPRAGHGEYDRLECLRWYVKKLMRDLDAAGNVSDLERELIRVQRATADLKELELRDRRASLMPRWLFEKCVQADFDAVRRAILPVAGEIASELAGLDRLEIKFRLHQKHRDVLIQLATGSDLEPADDETYAGENGTTPKTKQPSKKRQKIKVRK